MSAQFEEVLEVTVGYALECLRTATLPAALLVVVVLLIQLTCRRWLRPAQLGLLWGIVLLRLMLPAAPQSMFSLQSPFQQEPVRRHALVSPPLMHPDGKWILGPPVDAYAASNPPTVEAPLVVDESLLDWVTGWSLLAWSLVFMGILVVTPCRYLWFAFRLRRCSLSNDARLTHLLAECRAQLFVRPNVSLVATDLVRQPAVMGFWRPKLLLPSHVLARSDAELRMIFLHELAHVRQWDVVVNWLLLAVRAVHWPNPVYWLAASRFLHLREQARDAIVLQAIDGDARHDYSTLLLSLAEQGGAPARWRVLLPGLLPGLLCGLFEKRALAARLRSIQRACVRQPWWQTAIAIIVLVAALVTGCTDPLAASTELTLTTPDIATQLAVQQGLGRYYWSVGATHDEVPQDETVEPRSHDVTEAVKQVAEIHNVHVEVAAEAVRGTAAGILSSLPKRQGADVKVPTIPTVTSRTANDRRFIDLETIPSNHSRIASMIRSWESGGLTQVCTEVRFIASPIELGPAHGVTWSSLSAVAAAPSPSETESHPTTFVTGSSAIEQRLPVMTTVISEPTLRALTQLFQQHARSNILFAPTVTVFNGQSANVTSQVQRPFVTGVRLVEGRREPQIEVCPDGIQMEFRPVLTSDRQTTRLTGRALLNTIIDVKTTSAQLADGPVTIQLPQLERRTIDFQSDLRDGESILVACPPPSDGEGHFYMALTVRVLNEEVGVSFFVPAKTR